MGYSDIERAKISLRNQQIALLALQGSSADALADQFRVTRNTIVRTLREAGLVCIPQSNHTGRTAGLWVTAAEFAARRKMEISLVQLEEEQRLNARTVERQSEGPAQKTAKKPPLSPEDKSHLRAILTYHIRRDQLPAALPLPAFIATCKAVGINFQP